MSKHTPGPWEHDYNKPIFVDFHAAPYFSIGKFFKDAEQAKANASLIAAAPELLEALETVRRVLQGHSVMDIMLSDLGPCLGDVIRDAIKKARGE